MFILQNMSEIRAEILEVDENPPPDAPQYAATGKE